MRRRSYQARQADEWEAATQHIGLGIAHEPADVVQAPEDVVGSNVGAGVGLAQEEKEEKAAVTEPAADEVDSMDAEATEANVDDIVPRLILEQMAEPSSQGTKLTLATSSPRSRNPRPPNGPKIEKLDCTELFRMAQETADVMKEVLSSRSTSSKKSNPCDDLFQSVRSAATGAAACDALVLNDAQRARADRNERDAKFDALDDEIAWSTTDDSRLRKLVTGTPATAPGLRGDDGVPFSTGEADEEDTPPQDQFLSQDSLASQLLVRPATRPPRGEDFELPRETEDADSGAGDSGRVRKKGSKKKKSRPSRECGQVDRSNSGTSLESSANPDRWE